jgi:hypothetical protein
MYTPGIRSNPYQNWDIAPHFKWECDSRYANAMDKHEEYTNILEVKKTYSDRSGHNPEESNYYSAWKYIASNITTTPNAPAEASDLDSDWGD